MRKSWLQFSGTKIEERKNKIMCDFIVNCGYKKGKVKLLCRTKQPFKMTHLSTGFHYAILISLSPFFNDFLFDPIRYSHSINWLESHAHKKRINWLFSSGANVFNSLKCEWSWKICIENDFLNRNQKFHTRKLMSSPIERNNRSISKSNCFFLSPENRFKCIVVSWKHTPLLSFTH